MGIFNSILQKAGFGEIPKELDGKLNTPPSAVPLTSLADVPADLYARPMSVAGQLDMLASTHEEYLNWRESIVDLLELLGLHSDVETRRSLAVELGCPDDVISNTVRMDQWLHQVVLQRIEQNGGNVPPELFH